jgi:hypothetical protein
MNAARPEPRIDLAGPFWCFVLPRLGGVAITLPWRTVYILPASAGDDVVWGHELAHVAQIERDGALMWTLMYLWWCVRFGYWNNPYEVEARAKASLTRSADVTAKPASHP